MQMRQISEQDLPDIYCDMDQVLCNFMKGADAAVGGSFVNTDKDERWNMINQTKGIWANLEWMPGAKRMYQFIEKYDPYILSAASGRDPTSKVGKLKWLAKNTNFPKSRINLVMRSQKQQYAKRFENHWHRFSSIPMPITMNYASTYAKQNKYLLPNCIFVSRSASDGQNCSSQKQ